MKPSQYIEIRNIIQGHIDGQRSYLENLKEQVDNHPDESALRPATAEDVVPGAVIWYRKNEAGDWAWDEVLSFAGGFFVGVNRADVHIAGCYVEDTK